MKKKLLIPLALFFLAGLAAIAFYVRSKSGPRNLNPLQSVTADKIQSVELYVEGSTVTLVQTGGEWKVTTPYEDWGDDEIIDPLVNNLIDLSIQSVISENPGRFGEFSLEKRVKVFLKGSEEPLFDGTFGKIATGYDSSYFRFTGRNTVRIAFGFPVSTLSQTPDTYRQARILPLNWDEAREVLIRQGDMKMELVRSSATWTVAGATSPSNELLTSRVITVLRHFRVEGYPPAAPSLEEAGLNQPEMTVDVEMKEGRMKALIGRAKTGGDDRPWFGKTDGRDMIYTLRKNQVEALQKHVGELLGPQS